MDSVHNRSLFQTKSRDARKKLAKMGGIMASSPQLLQAGGMTNGPSPIMRPPMGYNMGGKITPPGTYPTNYMPGGAVAVRAAVPIMQTAGRKFGSLFKKSPPVVEPKKGLLKRAGSIGAKGIGAATFGGAGALAYDAFSSGKKEEVANLEAKMSLNDLVADVQSKLEAGENISAEVAQQLIEQLMPGANENDKKKLLETTGTDTSALTDLDDINKRIMDVAIAGTIGKSPEALNQAVLFGLQNYQATALARATASSKGGKSGMSPLEPFPDAAAKLQIEIMKEFGTDPAIAMRQAQESLAPLYQGQTTPTATSNPEKLRQQVEEAIKSKPAQKQQILNKAKEMGVDITGLE